MVSMSSGDSEKVLSPMVMYNFYFGSPLIFLVTRYNLGGEVSHGL